MTTVRIKELDLSTLHPMNDKHLKGGAKYIVIGAAGSGKSELLKMLLYCKKHILSVGHVFSGTEEVNRFFETFIPELFIYNGLEIEELGNVDKFVKRQKIARKYLEKAGFNQWGFEIIDDCTSDTKFLKKPIIKDIYKNSRHYCSYHILSLQYAMDIDSSIRTNVNGVFIFRESRKDMREKLFKYYASCIPTQSEFNQIMDELTEDYTCVYIDYTSKSNNMEDCIFYYKVDINSIPKGWKMGCEEYWNYAKERFDPNSKNVV